MRLQQGLALMGRKRTGPPWSVGRQTAHAPSPAATDRPQARPPTRPPAALQTTDDDDRRQQTPTTVPTASPLQV